MTIQQLSIDSFQFGNSFSACVKENNLVVDDEIESVYENQDDLWKKKAKARLLKVCKMNQTFDLDDLDDVLEGIEPKPSDKRCTGQLMKNAVKDGWCRHVRHVKSKRKSRHYGIISEYSSLVYEA